MLGLIFLKCEWRRRRRRVFRFTFDKYIYGKLNFFASTSEKNNRKLGFS
jgi:hypothetical protein